ncbi:VOC family protein [Solibacillus sp. MA9]|uniref:VOC family protein n=1 Tax=Solibacillus palustris TaxID=2908203 RepID=A0ABS9UH08_9BACL|nr:VOC family protein [Solibacillus sp. MA9]MCH7323518.1 VOC family protein [Solibacillus sp. MA9]
MPKIIPHLWFDKEAKEAANFYVSLFDDSKIINETVIENTPSGDTEFVTVQLANQEFQAISAGPYFQLNPSISFMVACYSKEEVDRLYAGLKQGGTELMPLGEYPFSDWYVWVQDRYGLSWQLMLVPVEKMLQKITPSLLFSHEVNGRAEEALHFYTGLFPIAELQEIAYFAEGEVPAKKANVSFARFQIEDTQFVVMDNGMEVDFHFNEAVSFIINCKDQEEIDFYWAHLSYVEEAEQCGWVKDRFGVSWQIVPANIGAILNKGSREENQRVTEAMLKMKKLDIAALERARNI